MLWSLFWFFGNIAKGVSGKALPDLSGNFIDVPFPFAVIRAWGFVV